MHSFSCFICINILTILFEKITLIVNMPPRHASSNKCKEEQKMKQKLLAAALALAMLFALLPAAAWAEV